MKAGHLAEAVLVRGVSGLVRALPWRASLAVGERLGATAHALGLRRRVAEDNLARAFPERDAAWRDAVLREHYRELGRVAVEYPRLPELAAAAGDTVVAEVQGYEHVVRAHALGRGVVALTAHHGNFELAGAWLGQRLPVDFVYKPLTNPLVEAWTADLRARARVGRVSVGAGVRRVFEALRAGRIVALLADQDARRHGVFVPFFGRPASTATGPAEIALRTGAPLVFAVTWRRDDGRHVIAFDPPFETPDPRAPDAVERLTALHVARLEARVRERPAMWFWLHRRWKSRPPDAGATGGR